MKLLIALAAAALLPLAACTSPTPSQTPTVAQPHGTIVFGRVNAIGDEYAFTIRADGTGEKVLVATPTCCMAWSHKGDRLVLGASPAGGASSRFTTAIVKADGNGYRVLPLDSSGLNLGATAWSADDTRLAFEGWNDTNPSINGLYIGAAIHGANRRLTTTTASQHDIPLSYSPDGSKILFWRGPSNTTDGQPAGQLFLVGVDGAAVTQGSPPGLTVWHDLSFGVQGGWSPDGAHISFSAFSPSPGDPGRSAVFVAAGDGTNAKQISDWGEYTTSARWSPTGDWIVFDKINAAAGGHTLYLVHPDGSGLKGIPSNAAACCAVWSPDGERLLFLEGPDQGNDLWTAMIDGSHLTQLTHSPSELTDVGWSEAR